MNSIIATPQPPPAEPSSATKVGSQKRLDKACRTSTALWTCLILSRNPSLQQHLNRSAKAAGWATTLCNELADAMRYANLRRFPLAMVDISASLGGDTTSDQLAEDREKYNDLLRLLNPMADGLVVVCDKEISGMGELWARQHGAWMYLPEVNEHSDLELLCREAKRSAEKLEAKRLADQGKKVIKQKVLT